VCLSQNLPAFYERIGGRNPQHTPEAYIGNFATKIFHANNCVTTNKYAADVVGEAVRHRQSWTENENVGDSRQVSKGENYTGPTKLLGFFPTIAAGAMAATSARAMRMR
jgi:hypothetical protein